MAGLWRKSIVNHVYYVAATAEGDPDLLAAMWVSVANHIRNIHEHDSELYEMCGHPPLDDDDRTKEWLIPGTKACELLVAKITSKPLVKDIKKLSPHFQTSNLEAFHSLIIRYAPKHTHFKWLCQSARCVCFMEIL